MGGIQVDVVPQGRGGLVGYLGQDNGKRRTAGEY